MRKEGVILELRNGWKWFLYLSEIIAIGGFTFLLVNLIHMVGIGDPASIFLLVFFVIAIICCVYALFYANNHKVRFTDEGIERVGVFGSKFIAFEDIEEVWFAPRFWDMKSSTSLLSGSRTLVFDYRYDHMQEALELLKTSEDFPEALTIYFDQEEVTV